MVAESIQQKMDAGKPSRAATVEAVKELAVPLFTATGTTLAAFVPMYMSTGSSGDFTRAIPIVVMTTLAVSYVYAVAVTPLMQNFLVAAYLWLVAGLAFHLDAYRGAVGSDQ